MIIDLSNLRCEGCPALYLRDKQLSKIRRWEMLREEVASSIERIRLYLLCESIPAKRFFYDETTPYEKDGLRYYLRKELVDEGSDDQLFRYLKARGILLVDCAVCPLHRLKQDSKKVLAATGCLKNNTMPYLCRNPKAPIITFFPEDRGFNPALVPTVNGRVIRGFPFPTKPTHLAGLRETMEGSLGLDIGGCRPRA